MSLPRGGLDAAKSASRTLESRQEVAKGGLEAAKGASGTLRKGAGGAPGGLPSEVKKRSVFGP